MRFQCVKFFRRKIGSCNFLDKFQVCTLAHPYNPMFWPKTSNGGSISLRYQRCNVCSQIYCWKLHHVFGTTENHRHSIVSDSYPSKIRNHYIVTHGHFSTVQWKKTPCMVSLLSVECRSLIELFLPRNTFCNVAVDYELAALWRWCVVKTKQFGNLQFSGSC